MIALSIFLFINSSDVGPKTKRATESIRKAREENQRYESIRSHKETSGKYIIIFKVLLVHSTVY